VRGKRRVGEPPGRAEVPRWVEGRVDLGAGDARTVDPAGQFRHAEQGVAERAADRDGVRAGPGDQVVGGGRARAGASSPATRSASGSPRVAPRFARILAGSTTRPPVRSTAQDAADPVTRSTSAKGSHSACQAPAAR